MTDFIVSLKLTADGKLVVSEVRKAEKSVKDFGGAAGKAGDDAGKFGRDVKGAGRSAREGAKEISFLKRSLRELSPVIGGRPRAGRALDPQHDGALSRLRSSVEGRRREHARRRPRA